MVYHKGRHTFGSLTTPEAGVPIETISKILRHTNLTITQVYAKVTPKKLFEDMVIFIKATSDTFTLDAAAEVAFLCERGYKTVGVVNHSEGGTIAFMLAAEGNIDFIISTVSCMSAHNIAVKTFF